MAERPRNRKSLFPNPFYVVLLASSTAFAITALAYVVSPSIAQRAIRNPGAAPGAGSRALAAWFDRNGPLALGIEIALMTVSGLLAMATDRWFTPAPARKDSKGS